MTLIYQDEAEEDYEEMNQNINSDDEEIAILEDDDPGLNSTDDENEGWFITSDFADYFCRVFYRKR